MEKPQKPRRAIALRYDQANYDAPTVVATGVPAHPVLRGARVHLLSEVRDALFAEVSRIAV